MVGHIGDSRLIESSLIAESADFSRGEYAEIEITFEIKVIFSIRYKSDCEK